jgi:cell division transport system permease protein
MLALRSDLPLRGDTASRFVSWLVMVLVFMAAFAVTVSAYVGSLLTEWDRGVTGTLTVQIPAGPSATELDAQLAKAVDVLSRHPAVAHAAALPRDKVVALLKPWLGENAVADLPLPALIDVELRANDPDAVAAVSASVAKAVPTAIVDDHRVWLNRVAGLAKGIGAVALAIVVLVTAALGLTIVFATRASLTEFAQVIEVLHVAGAKDGYVASQFARRALLQALLGGIAGLLLYAPALGLIAWLAHRVDPEILPRVSLPPAHWIGLAALPPIAAVLAMITANVTVRRTLAARV